MIIPFPQVATPGPSSMMDYAVQNTTAVLAYTAPNLHPLSSVAMNLEVFRDTSLPIVKPQPPNHKPYTESGFWVSIFALAALFLAVAVFYVKAYKDYKTKSVPTSDCRWDEMAPHFQVYREISSPRRGPIDRPPACITSGDSRHHRARSIERVPEGLGVVNWKKILVVE